MAKFVPIVSTNKNGDLFKIFIIYHSSLPQRRYTIRLLLRDLWGVCDFCVFLLFRGEAKRKKNLNKEAKGDLFPTFLTHMKNKLSCLPGLSFRFVCQAALKMHAEGSLSAGVFLCVCDCVCRSLQQTTHSTGSRRRRKGKIQQTIHRQTDIPCPFGLAFVLF